MRFDIALAAAGILLFASCERQKRSPFENEGAYAGMTFQQLDSLATRNESRRYHCVPTDRFRECWIQSPHTEEYYTAAFDTTDRLIYYRQIDTVEELADTFIVHLGFTEAERFRKQWREHGEQIRLRTPDGAAVEKYITKDRRWGAAIVTDVLEDGRPYVKEILLTNERTAPIYEAARPQPPPPWPRVPAMVLAESELERLFRAQFMFERARDRYATSIQELHFLPDPRLDIEIESAGPDGWWAHASHRDVPGMRCIIWFGEMPKPPSAVQRSGSLPGSPFCRARIDG